MKDGLYMSLIGQVWIVLVWTYVHLVHVGEHIP